MTITQFKKKKKKIITTNLEVAVEFAIFKKYLHKNKGISSLQMIRRKIIESEVYKNYMRYVSLQKFT